MPLFFSPGNARARTISRLTEPSDRCTSVVGSERRSSLLTERLSDDSLPGAGGSDTPAIQRGGVFNAVANVMAEVMGAGLNNNYELGLGLQDSGHCTNHLNLVKVESLESYKVQRLIAGSFSAAIGEKG